VKSGGIDRLPELGMQAGRSRDCLREKQAVRSLTQKPGEKRVTIVETVGLATRKVDMTGLKGASGSKNTTKGGGGGELDETQSQERNIQAPENGLTTFRRIWHRAVGGRNVQN